MNAETTSKVDTERARHVQRDHASAACSAARRQARTSICQRKEGSSIDEATSAH